MEIWGPPAKIVDTGPDFGHNLQKQAGLFLHFSNLALMR